MNNPGTVIVSFLIIALDGIMVKSSVLIYYYLTPFDPRTLADG